MPQEAVKLKIWRAKQKAISRFEKNGYEIFKSDNVKFCFIAGRKREARFIRVVVDKITDQDRAAVRQANLPPACSREIHCYRGTTFTIEEVES